jgi:arylformamidase
MKLHDISMEISEDVQVYKNKEEKKAKLVQQYDFKNSSVYETQLIMNLHTGTHIDAPLHAIENGETTENYNLEQFFGSCLVLDLMAIDEKITAKDLEKYTIKEDTFVILKTKNSLDQDFNYDFVYLEESGAKFLANAKIKGVGIDGLGIERNQSGHPTHKILLSNNIPILEGLRLKDIKEGYYEIAAFPIKIKDVEASPVRAVLIER